MLGAYDFCGHYEWTFEWLYQLGGKGLVQAYWDDAIRCDSQRHAGELIGQKGIQGMEEYWGHALAQEGAGYRTTSTHEVFRIDMHDCPSKGFLLRNGLSQYHDYCDHCIGWIGPLMRKAGFTVDHEHNHCGQCWWEIRRDYDERPSGLAGEVSGEHDVRWHEHWNAGDAKDVYRRATHPDDKSVTNIRPPTEGSIGPST